MQYTGQITIEPIQDLPEAIMASNVLQRYTRYGPTADSRQGFVCAFDYHLLFLFL